MKISFAKPFLSISTFPEVDLPDFTVITGLNGAGKSHLLQALASGALTVDCAPNQTEIRLFDWLTMIPQDTGLVSSEQVRNERASAIQQFSSVTSSLPMFTHHLLQLASRHNLPSHLTSDLSKLACITKKELEDLGWPEPEANRALMELNVATKQVEAQLLMQLPIETRAYVQRVAELANKTILTLKIEDLQASKKPHWGHAVLFQQSFGRLFVEYRDLHLANDLAVLQANKTGKSNDALSDDDFIKIHGVPP